MLDADSRLDPQALAHARALLAEPPPRESGALPALAAAAFFAVSALGVAFAMVAAPPVASQHKVERAR